MNVLKDDPLVLPALLRDATNSDSALKKFLNGLSGVDKVGVEERVARLGTRSIKTTAKSEGIDLAIRMIDLTTLEGMDTKGGAQVIKVKVPLAEMFGYVTVLRTLTSGRATSSMEFSHYSEVPTNVAKEVLAKAAK